MGDYVPDFKQHYLQIVIVAVFNDKNIAIKKVEDNYSEIAVFKIQNNPPPVGGKKNGWTDVY